MASKKARIKHPKAGNAWWVAWKRSLKVQRELREDYYERARRELAYCQHIRNSKARGVVPLTTEEFFQHE